MKTNSASFRNLLQYHDDDCDNDYDMKVVMKMVGREDLQLKLDCDMVGDWHSSHKVQTLSVVMDGEDIN